MTVTFNPKQDILIVFGLSYRSAIHVLWKPFWHSDIILWLVRLTLDNLWTSITITGLCKCASVYMHVCVSDHRKTKTQIFVGINDAEENCWNAANDFDLIKFMYAMNILYTHPIFLEYGIRQIRGITFYNPLQ